jgi:hypothetical protein
MLFGPKHCKQFRDAKPDGCQAVQTGVAGGADGYKAIRFVHRTLAMMHVKDAAFLPAARAPKVIAGKHSLTVAAKVRSRMPPCPVAL